MISPNQIGNLSFDASLLANNLNMPDRSGKVYDYSGGYNVIDFITSKIQSQSIRVTGRNGLFEKPLIGNSVVIAQVAATALVGTALRVSFTNPTYDLFRLQESVGDGSINMYQGKVIAKGPGFIDLEVGAGIAAWNTAIHFTPGRYAMALFPANQFRGSVGMQSLYEVPVYVSNQTSVIRETLTLDYADLEQAWVKYTNDGYWYTSQDMFLMKRFARARELRAIWSVFGNVGGVNYSQGLKESIKDPVRGGYYKTLTSLMSQADLEDFVDSIADRQNVANSELTILCGRGFLNRVQNFATVVQSIQFSGKANTFGGEKVEGLDVYKFVINGVKVNFIHTPIFNDADRFPEASVIPGATFRRMQYTGVAIDLNSYPVIGGGLAPAMEKRHFGPIEVSYNILSGVAMQNGGFSGSSPAFTSPAQFGAVSDVPAASFHLFSNTCYDFMSRNMGWMESI